MNTKCDATDDLTGSGPKPYYDKESGDAFDDTLLLRGYLCEARAIHTITAYDREVKSLTFFSEKTWMRIIANTSSCYM